MTEQRRYSDFDLVIERTGGEGYRARVMASPAGEADGSFTLPFSDLELENFMLKVGRPRRGTRRLESPEMEAARQFGAELFGAVFQDDIRLSLRRSLDEVERRGEGLRIRLRLTDTPELAVLPWEFLFSESNDQFLVLSAWTPIVRYLDLTQQIEPLTLTGPLRILVMISSPHDYPGLDVEDEWRRIEGSLSSLVDRGAVVIDRIEDATLLELQHKLRRNEYHIFHFLGHGGYDEQADDGVLVLEDGHNRSRIVAGRDLGTILRDHRSLRLAVLNACEGARASDSDPFSGAAQSLVRQGIPAVVAMQFEITDAAAIAFAQEFYAAIAEGLPVDASLAEARRAIFGLGNDIEWGTPVLYLRGDGQLFNLDTAAAPAVGVGAVVELEEPPAPDSPVPAETEAEVGGADSVETTVPTEAETEPDTDETIAVDGAAAVGAAVEPALVEAPSDATETGEATEEPVETTVTPAVAPVAAGATAAGTPSSVLQALRALPLWVMWAVIAVGAIFVVVLAVNIFGGDDTTDTPTSAAAPSTTPGIVATTPATVATTAATTPPGTVIANDATATALRTAEPKVIDGNAGDWPELVFHETDHVIYTHPRILDDTVARGGEENDSFVRLAWDESFLYVIAEVRDDVLSAPNTGNQIWRNDAVTLNISVIGTDGTISENPDGDDHQLTLSPGDPAAGTSEESVRFVGNGSAFSENFTNFADVAATHSPDATYLLEARIPWSEIGVTDPQPGDRFGLLVTVFDNDGEQLDGRWLQAEIKANTPGAGFQDPQTWGTLTLEG